MPHVVTAPEFDAKGDLPEWRYLLRRLEATYRAGSFDGAARFAADVAAAAESAGHHPDLDVRYPGRVHVVLTTHAAGGQVTTADVGLARTISELATSAGMATDPTVAQAYEVAIDAIDIDAVLPFWKAVLGYVDDAAEGDSGQVIAISDPARIGPAIWFQQMDEPRQQRNRIHIDVTVPHDVAEARVAAALDAGGRLVNAEYARAFWVLADPEGNEACVCTWQDRE